MCISILAEVPHHLLLLQEATSKYLNSEYNSLPFCIIEFIDNVYWLILSFSDILKWTLSFSALFSVRGHSSKALSSHTQNRKRITRVMEIFDFSDLLALERVHVHMKVTCLSERQGHLEVTGGQHCCWGRTANRVISASLVLLDWSWALKPACARRREAQSESSVILWNLANFL